MFDVKRAEFCRFHPHFATLTPACNVFISPAPRSALICPPEPPTRIYAPRNRRRIAPYTPANRQLYAAACTIAHPMAANKAYLSPSKSPPMPYNAPFELSADPFRPLLAPLEARHSRFATRSALLVKSRLNAPLSPEQPSKPAHSRFHRQLSLGNLAYKPAR